MGVFSLELARMYGYLYQKTDKNFTILHALDGYDEISLTGNTKMITNTSEAMLKPEDLNVRTIKACRRFQEEIRWNRRQRFS